MPSESLAKDLMRYADIRTTFNEYGNGLPAPMREANSKVVRMVCAEKIGVFGNVFAQLDGIGRYDFR